jgi:ferredoxin-NADP reductase
MRFRNSWIDAIVVDTQQIAGNVRQIQIQAVDGTQPFTVGAHIDVSVLIKEAAEIRSYSLVGRYEAHQPYTIGVKRLAASQGGSVYMWTLEKGNKIKISQPTNNFELSYAAPHYLLIAGGIGITPLVGMAEELSKHKNAQIDMIYVGKTASEMPFIKRLQAVLGDNLKLHFSDVHGLFDTQTLHNIATPQTQAYLCGPLGFMNLIRKTWEQSQYDKANLRFETFGASGLFAPQTFTVHVPRLGKIIQVPENQSLLNALKSAGVEVMYDCQKGECGLCQINILDCTGMIDHRDFFFSEAQKSENKKMCACVSRVANGDLVIDTAYRGKR